ncbi:MAG TPA: lipid-binding SYLF domain-containing protein [Pyrinomonadaceae bacterium]|nr:lipid-binding SYLF domain-containing protein [Pyrinomonadaceae bacterium]
MSSLKRIRVCVLSACAALCLCFVPASAQKAGRFVRQRTADAARHSNDAAAVLNQIMGVPDKAIPRELLEGAEAVAVCPGVLKAAFVVGGRKGDCIISRRTQKRQWGAPVFYNLAGGSFGAQIGASKTDYVLLFMNGDALGGLMKDKFEIGGEAEATAGPVGRAAGASTNPRLSAGILTYSRSKGLFAGLSLKGVAITPDNDLNEAFYGKKGSELIASQADTPVPTQVRAFPLALARYSVRQPH